MCILLSKSLFIHSRNIQGGGLAQLLECVTLDLGIVSSSTMLGAEII